MDELRPAIEQHEQQQLQGIDTTVGENIIMPSATSTLVHVVNQNAATAATWKITMATAVTQLIDETEYSTRPFAGCFDTTLLW